jgi:hypothetical protein
MTLRDVEEASTRLAALRQIEDYVMNPSRLSDIETKGVVPSIYRLYALSVIYRADFADILKLYGVDLGSTAADLALFEPVKTHRLEIISNRGLVNIPTKLDPGFDPRISVNLGRMIEDWGPVPLQYLQEIAKRKYSYGYIGSEDRTMYPLILPGSFVQIDEDRQRVQEGPWRSELERPIYFVETREGFVCCWCSMRPGEIILQPHPLSPAAPRILKHPQEAEVAGQVIGVAMRLVDLQSAGQQQQPETAELTEGEPKEVRRR